MKMKLNAERREIVSASQTPQSQFDLRGGEMHSSETQTARGHMNSQTLNPSFSVTIEPGIPMWKRCLDFLLIAALAPALILFSVVLAVLIKCTSPGPILFRQKRVGHKGREFVCFKFRTMQVNAETASHRDHTRNLMTSQAPMVKLDAHRDPRLAPLGAVLRATGLDELPQLLNVLRGEMSIVGPRPCLPYEYELYGDWERRRFNAAPGLTGLWQVSGKNRTTFKQMIGFDIEYAERQSLWLDLSIILKTFPALWSQCVDTHDSRRNGVTSSTARIAKTVQFNNL
jgi:lipopolysaccharide/colanic/teichoic acid biosynthesis glycosyltransferase